MEVDRRELTLSGSLQDGAAVGMALPILGDGDG